MQISIIRKSIALAVTASLFSAGVFAQDVNDVINKSLDAVGGKDKLSKLQSVYQEITISLMGNDLNSKVWIVNNKGLRMEMDAMGATLIFVANKDSGWMVNPMTGNSDPQALPAEQMKQFVAQMNLQGQLMNFQDRGYAATFVDKEQLNGKDVYKIKLSKTGEGDQVYFIDATTYLVTKLSVTVTAAGSTVTSDIAFSDYKQTPEGYTFPTTTTISSPQGEVKSTITKVVPNQVVDPKLFQKPQ
jgi:hypothetical protein